MLVYKTFRRYSHLDASWGTKEDALRKLKERLKGKGPYAYKVRGWDHYDRTTGLRRVMHRVHTLVDDCGEGDAVWVQTSGGSIYVLAIGRLVLDPVPQLNAYRYTEAVERIWRFLFTEIQRMEVELGRELKVISMGIYNYRHIDGSSSWSQHAWGNAVDFIIRGKDGSIDHRAMDVMTEALRHKGYVSQVLWRCSGHYDHAHISGDPLKTGTP